LALQLQLFEALDQAVKGLTEERRQISTNSPSIWGLSALVVAPVLRSSKRPLPDFDVVQMRFSQDGQVTWAIVRLFTTFANGIGHGSKKIWNTCAIAPFSV
jgi:hypothetical protein